MQRTTAIGIILLAVLLLAIGGWFWFRGNEQPAKEPRELVQDNTPHNPVENNLKPEKKTIESPQSGKRPRRKPVVAPRPFILKLTTQADVARRLKHFRSDNEAVERLYRKALTDPHPKRLEAVKQLGQMNSTAALPALIDLAGIHWPDARQREMFWEAVTKPLEERKKEIPVELKDEAIAALGVLRHPRLPPKFWRTVILRRIPGSSLRRTNRKSKAPIYRLEGSGLFGSLVLVDP